MPDWHDERKKLGPPGGGRPQPRRDDAPPPAGPRPDGGYFEEQIPDRPLKLWYIEPKTANRLAWEFATSGKGLTRTQLRRFFNHCTTIRRRLQANQNLRWDNETARDSFMKMAAAAAEAWKKDKIPEPFFTFLTTHVERVRNRDDFLRGFMPHFESIVGFSALYIER